jgi:uncharacterized membrane protein YdjX (TVP38/TMEM64 family)
MSQRNTIPSANAVQIDSLEVARHDASACAMTVSREPVTRPTSRTRKKLLIGGLFLSAIALVFLFDLHRYLTVETVKAHRDRLLAFTDMHYAAAVSGYILAYCLVVAMSLPGGAILTILGGFLFGPVPATLYVNVGATIGATVAFLSARYLLRDWVERTFGARLSVLQEGFRKNAFSYLLTLRLIPLFPFFLVNLVAGLTHVSLTTYIAATAIGIVPGTVVFAYAGRQLGTINSLSEIASPRVLVALTLLGLLMLLPVLYRKLIARKPVTQGSTT